MRPFFFATVFNCIIANLVHAKDVTEPQVVAMIEEIPDSFQIPGIAIDISGVF